MLLRDFNPMWFVGFWRLSVDPRLAAAGAARKTTH